MMTLKLPGVFTPSVADDGSVILKRDEGSTVAIKPLPEQMTGDELASRLFAEQGYLVIAASKPLDIGSLLPPSWCIDNRPHSCPLRIVALSSQQEFRSQRALAEKLDPGALCTVDHPYFYRVEAAD